VAAPPAEISTLADVVLTGESLVESAWRLGQEFFGCPQSGEAETELTPQNEPEVADQAKCSEQISCARYPISPQQS